MAKDWKFTLEKSAAGGASQKDHLKEPIGFKQDTSEINVRAGAKSGVNYTEMVE